jgi:hypothetical protein
VLKEAENRFVRYAWNQTKKWKIGETQKNIVQIVSEPNIRFSKHYSKWNSYVLTISTTLIFSGKKAHSLIAKTILGWNDK